MQPLSRILRITHYLSPPLPPKPSTIYQIHTHSSQPQNQLIYDYLINSFNFPKPKAFKCSNRFAKVQNLEKPESVINYFKSLGFTNTQIISSVNLLPQILFADIGRTLKPKIEFLQELGISGPYLCKFVSNNSPILAHSLSKKLKPSVETVRDILSRHNVADVNADLLLVLRRCSSIISMDHKLLLANVSYLESCGVKGSQLVKLLRVNPKLVPGSESYLKRQISKALDLGFTFDSRMFVHGLIVISSISNENFLKKSKFFKSFGFSDIEFMQMVKSSPTILTISEEKLRLGFEFYLGKVGLEKSVLIRYGVCLSLDMRNRVVPRYRVVSLLKSKGILKKEAQFTSCVLMSVQKFKETYITRFPDHAKDLWGAYEGHVDSLG